MDKKWTKPIFVITIIIIFLIFYSQMMTKTSGQVEVNSETKLEQALMKIEGVGQVKVYFHYDESSSNSFLSDYFNDGKKQDTISGLLVVSEGASSPTIQQKLLNIISRVMEVPAHRIMIVPMESKGDEK